MFDLLSLDAAMNSITGDIRDEGHLRRVIDDLQPEIVIHMAAQPLVRNSYADPSETFTQTL